MQAGAASAVVRHADLVSFQFDSAHLDAFIDLPFQIYKRDHKWIPPGRAGVRAQLARSNPWFQRGEARHFLIPGLGRVSAFCLRSPSSESQASPSGGPTLAPGDEVGTLGFFECVQDFSVCERLLEAAIGWLRDRGISTIRGPMNFDTWHSYRFVTSGFEAMPPFLLEPYNPPYYPEFWRRFGFEESAHYVSNVHEDLPALAESLRRHHEKSERSGFTFRGFQPDRFEDELKLFYDLSCEIFRDNWGYRPIGFDEFAGMYRPSRKLLDPGLVWFAYDPQGAPIGFIFGVPDLAGPVRAMRGRGGVLGALSFLAARRKPAAALLKTIGVLPASRGTNVGFALCYRHYRHMVEAGYRTGVHALMIQANTSRRMSETKGGHTFREYAVYDLAR